MVNADPYDESNIQTVNRFLQNYDYDQPFDPSTLITSRELQTHHLKVT